MIYGKDEAEYARGWLLQVGFPEPHGKSYGVFDVMLAADGIWETFHPPPSASTN
jgi:hypothetical protein